MIATTRKKSKNSSDDNSGSNELVTSGTGSKVDQTKKEKNEKATTELVTSTKVAWGDLFSELKLEEKSSDRPGNCQLTDEGLYGDIGEAEQGGARAYTIDYLYQTSVIVGTSSAEMRRVVIPLIDRSIAESLLPLFFKCDGSRRRRLQHGTIAALSSLPLDTFLLRGRKCSHNSISSMAVLSRSHRVSQISP